MDDALTTGTWTNLPGSNVVHVRTCRLDVVAGPDKGLSCTTELPTIRIGRGGTDLQLTDRKVSGVHAEIRFESDGYRLRDLGSTNGTWLRGGRIVEAFIEPGGTFAVGDSLICFAPLTRSVEVRLYEGSRLGSMVGRSVPMRMLFATIERIAPGDSTVLVTGESGTGKELVAEAIHDRSSRASGPLVVVDCGAVPATLFEAQLFGHEKGAFTGAIGSAPGCFERAHGGTLFLDEIGELPLDLQAKLLRAVERREVRRVGGSETIPCDVRIVAATNRDLALETNRGAFRSDLYYRLAVVEIRVPPLRERMDDLELLVETLAGERRAEIAPEFFAWARCNTWPGNVRQLRNAIERLLSLGEWSRFQSMSERKKNDAPPPVDISIPFREAKQRMIDDFDRRYLRALLDAHDGNVSAAARSAGLDRTSIYKAMLRVGMVHTPAPDQDDS